MVYGKEHRHKRLRINTNNLLIPQSQEIIQNTKESRKTCPDLFVTFYN